MKEITEEDIEWAEKTFPFIKSLREISPLLDKVNEQLGKAKRDFLLQFPELKKKFEELDSKSGQLVAPKPKE